MSWLSGITDSGKIVEIPYDPYLQKDPVVWVDNEKQNVFACFRYRGWPGTVLELSNGDSINVPHQTFDPDEPATLNGEVIRT